MEFFKLIKKRHSVRIFKKRMVEYEKLNKILEAARLAPSAGNLQAYKIAVVKETNKKEKLANAAYCQMFVKEAPVVLVFFSDPNSSGKKYGERGETLYCIQDATIAATYAQLAATDLGLGSVWVGAFDPEEVKKILNVKKYIPIAMLPIGYPNEVPFKTERKKISEILIER